MARPPKFHEDVILDAALLEGAELGFERVSASRVAKRLKAPSGSLYHRYPSRDVLMARLWLRTVDRFQAAYLAAITGEGTAVERARRAAQLVVRWAADHPTETHLLTRYRQRDLLQGTMPADVANQADGINKRAAKVLAELAVELDPDNPDSARLKFACVTVPMAAARDVLSKSGPSAETAISLVLETVDALLSNGGRQ